MLGLFLPGIGYAAVTFPELNLIFTAQDGFDGFTELNGATYVDTISIGSNTYAVVSSVLDDGLQFIDITDPNNPLPIAGITNGTDFEFLDAPREVVTATIGSNTYAMVAGFNDDSVTIIDMTDPANPSFTAAITNGTGSFTLLDGPRAIEITTIESDTYAVVTSHFGSSVTIINMTTPSNPLFVAEIQDDITPGFDALRTPWDLDIVTIGTDTFAVVVSNNDHAIQIINMTDPAAPLSTATIVNGTDGFDMITAPRGVTTTVIGSDTYILSTSFTGDGVQITNMTDPTDPVAVAFIKDGFDGFTALEEVRDIEVITIESKPYAITSSRVDDGFQIINITDPSAPTPVGTFIDSTNLNPPAYFDIVTIDSRDYVVAASFNNRFHILSFSTLFTADLVDSIDILDMVVSMIIPPEPEPEPEPEPTPAPAQTKSKSSGGSGRTGVSMSEMYEKTGRSTFDKVKEWVSSDEYFQIGIKNLIVRGSLDTTNQIPTSAPEWFFSTGLAWKNGQIQDKEYFNAAQYLIDNNIMK